MTTRTPANERARITLPVLLAAAIAALALPAAARLLPHVDALAELPAPPAAKAAREDARVSRMHVEPRLGMPTFVWLRPGAVAAGDKSLAGLDAESAARQTLRRVGDLYGLGEADHGGAALKSAERLSGGAHLVRFQNRLEGIDVFRESAAVILGNGMEPVAVGGLLGPTASAKRLAASAAAPFRLSAAQAIAAALDDYRFGPEVLAALRPLAVDKAIAASAAAGYEHFAIPRDLLGADGARMNEAARAKRVWFRLPAGLVPAWYVELQMAETRLPGLDYYAYVIAADDGRLLFRNNQTADAAFTYRVYAEPTGNGLPLPGPAGRGATPHPTGLNDGFVPPFVPANLVTLQNGPISTNDPWLPVGSSRTVGNNIDAYSNRYAQNPAQPGGDAFDLDPLECNMAVAPTADFRACTSAASTFDYAYDHDAEALANKTQSAAGVVNLFYLTNWLHDWFYDAGFKEVDGNAQVDNYGRGGLGGDSMKAQAEDNAGVNNANMSTPADGGRPRMRMYIFTGGKQTTLTATPGGVYASGSASFGPASFNVTATAGLVDDGVAVNTNACEPIINNVVGRIAVIDRGTCSFQSKVNRAQAAGAVGAVIVNNVVAALPPGLGADATQPQPLIPVLSVTLADGNAIKAALLSGPVTIALVATKDPDRDGALDNGVITHEWGHYISNRLVGDANGLTTNLARGLGEGWADFHALLLMLKEGDSLTGTYAAGGYDVKNYYYGIRRYPYSRDFAKNPLTYKHIADENALPLSPPPSFNSTNSEVHNTGEIWSTMLWQCYTALAGDSGRLTFAQAQDRMKRYLVAGYKLTPVAPTLLEARDAILAAMAASDTADFALCTQAFAERGAGARAVSPDRFTTTNNGVAESFVTGGDLQVTAMAFEPRGAQYCDADGALDNGETALVSVTVKNVGSIPLAGASLTLSSATPGVAFPDGVITLPSLAPFASTTVKARVTLSGAAAAGSAVLDASVIHPSFALPTPATASLAIPIQLDRTPAASAMDDAESESPLWTASLVGEQVAALNWIRAGDVTSGRYYKAPTGGGAAVAWLTSPALTVAAPGNVTLTIKHRHAFEADTVNWDGGVIEVSFDNGSTWTDLQVLVPGIYGGVITDTSGNPLGLRPAFVGNSAGYPAFNTVPFTFPAPAGTMRVRFGAGTDVSVGTAGWDVDDIAFTGIANTPFEAGGPHAGLCVAVSAFAGTPQVTAIGAAFGTPLTVRVLSAAGAPVPNGLVTFTAPGAGASGTFATGGTTASVLTDASGDAVAPLFTANATAGTYAVTAVAGQRSAAFVLTNSALFDLSVAKAGLGQGTVSSTVPGITCGGDCAETYPVGASITLTATASAGSVFEGWSGACSGTGDCVVPIDAAKAVTATFGLDPVLDADGDGISNAIEVAEGRNPLVKDNDVFTVNRLFAMQQYRDFLGREGDAGGLAFYAALLDGDPGLRAGIIEAFFNSPEFSGTVSPIARLYFAAFLRIPDYAGLQFQVEAFRAGTPLTVIANNFTLSPEFQATYGALTDAQYVALLYTNILQRAASQPEIDFHVARLTAGATRGEVLAGFSESPEYQASTANDVYVTMMYVGMLRRSPEQSGFDFWVAYMDAGNPGIALIAGFLNSLEYHNRFLP